MKESLSLFKTRVKQTLSTLWPLLLLGAVLFALLAVVGGRVWQDYRTALIDSQTRQMELSRWARDLAWDVETDMAGSPFNARSACSSPQIMLYC